MGQDVQGMGYGERAICLSLFVCLLVAVFSSVSLIYLTSIVYVPVQNELEAGFIPEAVMCTSIRSDKVKYIIKLDTCECSLKLCPHVKVQRIKVEKNDDDDVSSKN